MGFAVNEKVHGHCVEVLKFFWHPISQALGKCILHESELETIWNWFLIKREWRNVRFDNACLASIETEFKCAPDCIMKGFMIRVLDIL